MPSPKDKQPPLGPDLPELERRARSLTGATMGAVALAATYALLLLTDKTADGRVHLYPLVAAALFYLAGDLIALVWFRLLASQLAHYIRQLEAKQRAALRRIEAGEALEDDDEGHVHAAAGAADDGVEVIKPGAAR